LGLKEEEEEEVEDGMNGMKRKVVTWCELMVAMARPSPAWALTSSSPSP
jgi:hypothetical protein